MSQPKRKARYQVSKEIVQAFHQYLRWDDLAFAEGDLLDLINYGKSYSVEASQLHQRSREFRNDVMNVMPGGNADHLVLFNSIPDKGQYDVPFEGNPDEMPQFLIYGTIDYQSFGTACQFITLNRYEMPEMNDHADLWIMHLMRHKKVHSVDFLLESPRETCVYRETYTIKNFDFTTLYERLERLETFLEKNRHLITNKTIFL